jgi:hypothetical protein
MNHMSCKFCGESTYCYHVQTWTRRILTIQFDNVVTSCDAGARRQLGKREVITPE